MLPQVISGYVVTGSLLHKKSSTTGQFLLAFYARRIKRLTPALVCMILGSTMAFSIMLPPYTRGLKDYYLSAQFGLIGLANVYFSSLPTGYFDEGQGGLEHNPYMHTWSLGVEEQFYLVFPLLVAVAFGKRVTDSGVRLPGLVPPSAYLFGTLCISLIISTRLTMSKPSMAFYLLTSRFWQLMSGALLFEIELQQRLKLDASAGSHDRLSTGKDGAPPSCAFRAALAAAEIVLLVLGGLSLVCTPSKYGFPIPWSFLAIVFALGVISIGSSESVAVIRTHATEPPSTPPVLFKSMHTTRSRPRHRHRLSFSACLLTDTPVSLSVCHCYSLPHEVHGQLASTSSHGCSQRSAVRLHRPALVPAVPVPLAHLRTLPLDFWPRGEQIDGAVLDSCLRSDHLPRSRARVPWVAAAQALARLRCAPTDRGSA